MYDPPSQIQGARYVPNEGDQRGQDRVSPYLLCEVGIRRACKPVHLLGHERAVPDLTVHLTPALNPDPHDAPASFVTVYPTVLWCLHEILGPSSGPGSSTYATGRTHIQQPRPLGTGDPSAHSSHINPWLPEGAAIRPEIPGKYAPRPTPIPEKGGSACQRW